MGTLKEVCLALKSGMECMSRPGPFALLRSCVEALEELRLARVRAVPAILVPG